MRVLVQETPFSGMLMATYRQTSYSTFACPSDTFFHAPSCQVSVQNLPAAL